MQRFILCVAFFPSVVFAEDLVPVGTARVDITPEYRVRLSGYGNRREESFGIDQRIWAKALAIGDNQNGVVLVTVDNLGVPEEINAVVAAQLKERFGWDRSRLAVCSSHTHSAPMLTNVAPTLFGMPIPPEHQEKIDRYTKELTGKLVALVLEAIDSRQPGRLEFSRGKVSFAANRRTPNGPVDHDLPVLRITDANGKVRAILVNYACHCTTLGGEYNRIHGDWAGYVQEFLERSNPGCTALVAIGCGADANPSPRPGLKFAAQHAEALVAEVQRLLKGAWRKVPGPPQTKYSQITLAFDTIPSRAVWEQRAKQPGAVGYHAQVQLKQLDAGKSLPTTLPYPVQTWTFGNELVMIFLGGEVVVDYSLRAKREFDAARIWVNAYSNDVPCYIPSVRILKEGGYEAEGAMIYYNRPTRFAPDVEERIFQELQRQIPASFSAQPDRSKNPPPQEPEQSRRAIQTRPGFRVELVAAEPLVHSPVAIDWGPDGKLWVVEMYDYPCGIDGQYKPGGRVKYLVDRDGDGRYDQAVTLADDLPFPTGVMAWGRGVLVCAAPDVLYLEDQDGDGKADIRQVILTGFETSNFQARVNGLCEGLDGWIYAANGLFGGRIVSQLGRKTTVDLGGRDLRFRPDTGDLEAVSGLTQQGRVRDDWGNWFGNDNSHLLWHYPLNERYLQRNPNFVTPSARVDVTLGDADPNRLFPISQLLERFNDPHHAGRVTSACGPTIYRDDLLGAELAGNAFICEPVHNIVTRRVLKQQGLTFSGRRSDDEQSQEFLASTDPWFRPVQVRTGPDGALWVVDMYRMVIEHPRWIPPDRLATIDVRSGADRGRIYRIVPDERPLRSVPRINELSSKQLVGLLESRNGVVRDLAHRRLLNEKSSVTQELKRLVTTGNDYGRLHALTILATTGRLDGVTLRIALRDPRPEIRVWAIRSAEELLSLHPSLESELLALENDPAVLVRCQLALTLGFFPTSAAAKTLARLAARDGEDPYFRAAVLSSLTADSLPVFFQEMLQYAHDRDPARQLLPSVAGIVPALLPQNQWATLLTAVVESKLEPLVKQDVITAVIEAAERRRLNFPDALQSIITLVASEARRTLADAAAPLASQVRAIRLLGRSAAHREADISSLAACLRPQKPLEIQHAALERLSAIDSPLVAEQILGVWSELAPSRRRAALDVLLSRQTWTESMIVMLEKRAISAADLTASQRQRLLQGSSTAWKDRVEKALQGQIAADRQVIVENYARAIQNLRGDARRGEDVFGKSCAPCHRVGNVGQAIGPDLAAVTARDEKSWLISILDPNRALDGRYSLVQVTTRDGRQFSGMIHAETANNLVLQAPGGQRYELLRDDIEDIRNTGRSLMPEGLEQEIAPTAMADLLAFLQSQKPVAKKIPGNRPGVIQPETDGSIRLPANQSEIYGNEITLEPEFKNVGLWHSSNDHILWRMERIRPGRYSIELRFACADSSSGNWACIETSGQRLEFQIPATGGWDRYITREIGTLDLSTNPVIVIRPVPPLRGALMDLQEVRLRPASR